MKLRLLAALGLLASVVLSGCDTSTPPTPTPVSSTGTPITSGVGPVAVTATATTAPSAPETPTPAGVPIELTPIMPTTAPVASAEVLSPTVASTPSGTPGTPTATPTPLVKVQVAPDSIITETRLVEIDAAQWIRETFTQSLDRRHVGYISAAGSRYVMIIDGNRSNEYPGVLEGTLTFSPDSKRNAYGVVKNTNFGPKGLIVLDGVEQKGRYDLLEAGVVFSPDSSRLAFGATRGDKHVVIVDGQEGDEYSGTVANSIRFSPDSKQVVHVAGVEGDEFVVKDGKPQKVYNSIVNLAWSPDSQHLAYLAVTGPLTVATGTGQGELPPDPAKVPVKRVMVYDGKEGKPYDGFNPNALAFSADSKHVAYVVQEGVKQFVVMDGQEGPKYDVLGGIVVFSPDSKHMAYAACTGTCTGPSDSKWRIVLHDVTDTGMSAGREGKEYSAMGTTIGFSPDNRYLAFVVAQGGKQFVVVAGDLSGNPIGVEGEPYDGIGRGTVFFSPDSQRLAYVAGAGGKQFVVADGKRGPDFDSIGKGSPVFSPDSRHIAYIGGTGEKQTIVLDGKPGKQYDVAGKGGPVFSEGSLLHYLAVENNADLRLSTVWFVEHLIK